MRKLIAMAIATVVGASAFVGVASADPYYRHHHHRHHQSNAGCKRRAGNTGTIVGGIGGAVVGNSVSHGGGKLGSTLIGAGVGAVAGHEIAKHNAHC
jgi:hypothetical protein